MKCAVTSMTPDGTLLAVVLLTDVEGSSQLWRHYGSVMTTVLDSLDAIVEREVSRGGGTVVKARGEGDSHFVVFGLASAAVCAAAALQRALLDATWPRGLALGVRAAIHAGEVYARDGDYVGTPVNHAARLRSTAHGGQVVVSRAIVELAGGIGEQDLWFRPLGRHQLRDVPGWTEVFQLCGPGLPDAFPPLSTVDTGIPPVAAVVFLDVVGATEASEGHGPDGDVAFLGQLGALFKSAFTASGGQYLKLLGDGCLALFADPESALRFVRAARADALALNVSLRGVIHLGRVEFVGEEPAGRSLQVAAKLLRRAPPDRVGLTRVAAMVLGESEDAVTLD